ncbi:Hypothetical predicted protein [Mytilus galloprovincialis]|uniref:Uncharacterized protein n=1 Tax=Mytilus galloprovincialis TaxID=29158 RepID=A0A8B6GVI9_MYTGA|nr:Hypothetical predicted protein [Mytilus galloprovincialis]
MHDYRSAYTRWGRKDCPLNETELVYTELVKVSETGCLCTVSILTIKKEDVILTTIGHSDYAPYLSIAYKLFAESVSHEKSSNIECKTKIGINKYQQVFEVQSQVIAEDKRLLLNDPDVMAQIKQMSLELQTLKQKTSQLEQDLGSAKTKVTQLENSKSGFGSVYTRWGRKDCPSNGTELVYTGVTGGGLFDHTGSAVNYVCLPHDPDFIQGDTPGGSATLYGSEYQDNYFGHNLYNNDVPCAVCRAVTKSSVVMIPGKTKCYGDWNREFYGRLASGADSHVAASEYVCVDHQAQYIEGGAVDNNGKLFYKVGAKCGSLPCPPYYDMAPMSCVVCSK